MPQSARFQHGGAVLCAEPLTEAAGPVRLVWLHGWGNSREALRPLAATLADVGEAWLLDLPGHGEAPNPPEAYGPGHYARLVHAWLATLPPCPTVVVGHSMGFRVAVHMAAQASTPLLALVGVAGAGVPRALSGREAWRRRLLGWALGFARWARPYLGEGLLARLRRRFGSTDYLNVAPELRPTFLALVNDDVTPLTAAVTQPVLLVYGEEDGQTPPSTGRRFQALLPRATLEVLPRHDHHSLLQGGRHVVSSRIRAFLAPFAGTGG